MTRQFGIHPRIKKNSPILDDAVEKLNEAAIFQARTPFDVVEDFLDRYGPLHYLKPIIALLKGLAGVIQR